MPDTLSINEARRIALAAQGFDRPRPSGTADLRHIRRTLNLLGIVQIDFVNVLTPAHYLVPFSRLGPYNTSRMDHLIYHRREFTEQWAHEASIVPMATWPLLQHKRDDGRKQPIAIRRVLTDNPGYLGQVLDEVSARGPLCSDDIPSPGGLDGGAPLSWYRSARRMALETHFATGAICVAGRRRDMARAFDLTERVVPLQHRMQALERREQLRRLVDMATRAHGLGTVADLADYYRMSIRDTRDALHDLTNEGSATRVQVEGWKEQAWMHADARAPKQIRAAALLSPFDPLVWFRPRAHRLFDFDYRIEIYRPERERKYGYYVLPFLMDDRIVARVDLKADRKNRRLLVAAAHIEPGEDARPTALALAAELRIVATWLNLGSIDVGKRGTLCHELQMAVGKLFWQGAE